MQPSRLGWESTNRARVLVVEDDPATAALFTSILEQDGYRVRHAPTGARARSILAHEQTELIVLDLILPDEDGLVLCAVLRGLIDAPILVCSASRRRRDGFLSLKLGAVDFLAKPFDIYDFSARVEALLRLGVPPFASSPPPPSEPLRIGALIIDEANQQALIGGAPIQLTPTELRLLSALAMRVGELVSRRMLGHVVWGDLAATSGRTIDVHVARLRRKLAAAHVQAPDVVSVRGGGYKLVLPTDESAGLMVLNA